MGTSTLYRNIVVFLVSLIIFNLAVGFFKTLLLERKTQSTKVNYSVLDSKKNQDFSEESKLNFIDQSKEMNEIFDTYNFSADTFLSNQNGNIIIFSSLPKDFMSIESTMERKKLFTNTLVPIIFIENQKILNDRKKILDWLNEMEGESISKEFWPQWLLDLSKKYDYKESNLGNLLMRVDIVPISLALGQAAIESGWGTSRYAREGNAIFGQYTFDKNQGLKPNRREKDKDFLIKRFSNLSESTMSYLKNLNTHRAYEKFRQKRKNLRMNGENLSGKVLLEFLQNYSERRENYISDLKKMIRSNYFSRFDFSQYYIN